VLKIVENLWAVGAPPWTTLGISHRSPGPLAGGEVLPPPQEPYPALGLFPFGLGPQWKILDTTLAVDRRGSLGVVYLWAHSHSLYNFYAATVIIKGSLLGASPIVKWFSAENFPSPVKIGPINSGFSGIRGFKC